MELGREYPGVYLRGKHFKNRIDHPFYSLKELSAESGLPVFTDQRDAKIVINWGRGGYGRVPRSVILHLNESPCVDKYASAQRMLRVGAATPKAWSSIRDIPGFPVVMKPLDSWGGHGIRLVRDARSFTPPSKGRGVWFQGLINKDREFRVYFWRGRVTMVEEKERPANRDVLTWNRKYCPRWMLVRDDGFKRELSGIIAPAAEALGIDWGAADVARDRRGSLWIIEINTRPSATHPGEERGKFRLDSSGIWQHTGGSEAGSSSRMWSRVWRNFLRDEYRNIVGRQ